MALVLQHQIRQQAASCPVPSLRDHLDQMLLHLRKPARVLGFASSNSALLDFALREQARPEPEPVPQDCKQQLQVTD
jgi:hypothetical protein